MILKKWGNTLRITRENLKKYWITKVTINKALKAILMGWSLGKNHKSNGRMSQGFIRLKKRSRKQLLCPWGSLRFLLDPENLGREFYSTAHPELVKHLSLKLVLIRWMIALSLVSVVVTLWVNTSDKVRR